MTITEFLLARIADDEAMARYSLDGDLEYLPSLTTKRGDVLYVGVTNPARVLAECAAKRAIIDFHRSWPVLVETPPEMTTVDGTDPSAFAYQMTQRIMWATEDEYRKRFGTEPPTAPMLRALAAVYANHPDYQQEWA